MEKEILVFKLISESSPNSAFVVAASFFASGFGFRVEAKWGLVHSRFFGKGSEIRGKGLGFRV